MDTSPLMTEGRQLVQVRLSDIPYDLRHKVAQDAIERNKMRAEDALKLRLAAEAILGDPVLVVPAWKVEYVMAGKQPPGETPQAVKEMW